jgi:branched-chain amino acid transport system permease protein
MKFLKTILLVLFILFLIMAPIISNNAYLHLILCQTLVNVTVVMGLNFITGLTGQMNLGTAGIMALGGYSAGLFSTHLGVSPWIGFLAAIAMGLAIGWILGYPSLRLKGVYLSLTTIGFSEITRLVITNWVSLTGGTLGLQSIPRINLFGLLLDSSKKIFYLYLFFVVLLGFISNRIVTSRWGRLFKAIRDNVDAVEACGVDIASVKIKAFTLASVFGCFGGAMYAYLLGYLNPTTFTTDLSANYLMMMMLGGIGSVTGNIVGAIMVTLLPEFLRFMDTYYWLVFGVIALIFAIFLPNGIISPFTRDYRYNIFWLVKKIRHRGQR